MFLLLCFLEVITFREFECPLSGNVDGSSSMQHQTITRIVIHKVISNRVLNINNFLSVFTAAKLI